MKNNSIKFYKQAAKWIKTAESPDHMQRGGLSIYDIPADYIERHQNPKDPDNDLYAQAVRNVDRRLRNVADMGGSYYRVFGFDDPIKRQEAIGREFARRLLLNYDTEMRRDHYRKFDSNDELYDPEYQNASTNAFPEFVKNYDNPDFWVGNPEYDKRTIDDIIRKDMPDMTYVAPSQQTIDEQPEGYINRGFDLFATAANPSIVLHALNGRAASEAPNVNPKWWPKNFEAKGFDFWPMRDWSEGGPVDTQYQEARANNLRHWENTRNTFKPLEGKTRLARAGEIGRRAGRLPIRALDWGFNKVLMPFASYQMTNEGIHRLRDAANSNGLLETGYNASVGALDTAAGVTLAADIANKSPFIYNMASKLGGMRYLRGISPRVANMSRFLGEASGPLFAATVITDPVVEWADNTFRGLPAMEYAGNAKSEKLQRYSAAIQAINEINAAEGEATIV